MTSIRDAARSDPLGAGIIVCAVLLATTLGLWEYGALDAATDIAGRQWRKWGPWKEAPDGPLEWLAKADKDDVLPVPGYPVAYWGNPDAPYGVKATEDADDPTAIIIHHTAPAPTMNLVRYGHRTDGARGGAYGYHFYVGRDGEIVQGAPLSRRTNHIKPPGSPQRKPGPHDQLANTNAIGITLVGGCVVKPNSAVTERCSREEVTEPQMTAARAVVRAVMERYDIYCSDVWGHGDLQTDREGFEGADLAAYVRRCEPPFGRAPMADPHMALGARR